MLHVIGRRVLANASQERYFARHGMPAPPPLVRAQRRSLAGIAEGDLPSDPATDRFIDWSRSTAAPFWRATCWSTPCRRSSRRSSNRSDCSPA